MLGAQVSDTLLIALLAVSFPLVVGLLAWIVRELSRISTAVALLEQRMGHYELRLAEFDHWREHQQDRNPE
jgi:hypothetical protein